MRPDVPHGLGDKNEAPDDNSAGYHMKVYYAKPAVRHIMTDCPMISH